MKVSDQVEIKALVQAHGDGYDSFMVLWDRANELRDVISRLPGSLVMKSGMSGQRNRLLGRWDSLKTPGLDGAVPDGAHSDLNGWIHDAEVLIGYIVQIGRGAYEDHGAANPDVVSVAPEESFTVIDKIDEAMGVSKAWCWPWKGGAASPKKTGFDKGKLIKYGAIAGLGVMAIMTYINEED